MLACGVVYDGVLCGGGVLCADGGVLQVTHSEDDPIYSLVSVVASCVLQLTRSACLFRSALASWASSLPLFCFIKY